MTVLRGFDGFYVWEVQVLYGCVPHIRGIQHVTVVCTVTWYFLGRSGGQQ